MDTRRKKHTEDVADKGPTQCSTLTGPSSLAVLRWAGCAACICLKIDGEHALTKLRPASNDAKLMNSCEEIAHPPSIAEAQNLLDTGHPVVDYRLNVTRTSLFKWEGHNESGKDSASACRASVVPPQPLNIVSACRLEAQSWRLACHVDIVGWRCGVSVLSHRRMLPAVLTCVISDQERPVCVLHPKVVQGGLSPQR